MRGRSVNFRVAGTAGFETFVDPEVLFGREADVFFDEAVDADGVGGGVGGREIFERRKDGERVVAVGFAAGEVGDDGRSRHFGEFARGGVGDGGHAEEREDFALFGALALIGRIPDGVAAAEGADETFEIVEVDGGFDEAFALRAHFGGDDGIVGIAVEHAQVEAFVHHARANLERGEMSGEENRAAAFGDGAVEMFVADDGVRRKFGGTGPPAGAGFEQAEGERVVVGARERADFGGGFFGEAETEVNERDVATDGNDVVNERPEQTGEGALDGPGQAIGEAEAGEADPHGPVLGEPEAIFFAGAAHGRRETRSLATGFVNHGWTPMNTDGGGWSRRPMR